MTLPTIKSRMSRRQTGFAAASGDDKERETQKEPLLLG